MEEHEGERVVLLDDSGKKEKVLAYANSQSLVGYQAGQYTVNGQSSRQATSSLSKLELPGNHFDAASKPGLFGSIWRSVKSGVSSVWEGTKSAVSKSVGVMKKPYVILITALGASMMAYSGGLTLVEALGPGKWLLAFTVGGLVLTLPVTFRPKNERGKKAFKTSHVVFYHLTKGLSSIGLQFLLARFIALKIEGAKSLSWLAKKIVPASAFVSGTGTYVTTQVAKSKIKVEEDASRLKRFLSKGAKVFAATADAASSVGGILYILRHYHEGEIGTTPLLIVAGTFAAVGLVNETVIRCYSEKTSFVVKCVVEGVKGLGNAAFLFDQVAVLDAVANDNHDSTAGIIAAGVVIGVMVGIPNAALNVRNEMDERGQLFKADESAVFERVAWSFPEGCCERRQNNSVEGYQQHGLLRMSRNGIQQLEEGTLVPDRQGELEGLNNNNYEA